MKPLGESHEEATTAAMPAGTHPLVLPLPLSPLPSPSCRGSFENISAALASDSRRRAVAVGARSGSCSVRESTEWSRGGAGGGVLCDEDGGLYILGGHSVRRCLDVCVDRDATSVQQGLHSVRRCLDVCVGRDVTSVWQGLHSVRRCLDACVGRDVTSVRQGLHSVHHRLDVCVGRDVTSRQLA